MRLICPNCGAQYEVPAEVIPAGGRDVQCSNCAHTWYQSHPDDDPVLTGAPAPETPAPDAPPPEPASPDTLSQEDWLPEDEPEPLPEPPAPEAAPKPRARGLDPTVAEVLREEAEREARQRAAESTPLESQPELGLEEPAEDEAARRAREARDRMATIRGEIPETAPKAAAATAATAASSRRELLPDIEEINQTLRASSERPPMETPQGRAAAEEETRGSGGFGRGFRLVLALAVIAAGIYVLAPRLATMMPGAAPALSAYTQKVDTLRLWLDGQVAALTGGN